MCCVLEHHRREQVSRPLQAFQFGSNKARVQSRPAAAHTTSPGNTQPADKSKSLHTTDQSTPGQHATDQNHAQASPQEYSAHTATTSSQQSVSLASSSAPKSAKRKRNSKADQLRSLQDAPGVPEKLGDQPLRLIIVGHNPSDHAW